jgi:transglutaminase-like putative cysteine protease
VNRSAAIVFTLAATTSACASGNDANKETSVAAQAAKERTAPTRSGAKTRHFTFRYEASLKAAPPDAKEVDLWLPVAQDADFQKVKVTAVSAPASHTIEVEPTLGNKIFHVKVPASSLPLNVAIDYDVERIERRTDFSTGLNDAALSAAARKADLEATPLVPVGAPVVAMSGFKSGGGDATKVARQAYDHVLGKMKYDKPANSGWGRGSTEWACKEGFGNCTDFHAYFMSLARTENIPCRFTMGFGLPPKADAPAATPTAIPGYHCWAEFFVDGRGWVPVDISEASKAVTKMPEMADYYFGGLSADRIEFTLGRDVPLVPKQAGKPLNYFIYPYCEIDGKEAPKDSVTRNFSIKDA